MGAKLPLGYGPLSLSGGGQLVTATVDFSLDRYSAAPAPQRFEQVEGALVYRLAADVQLGCSAVLRGTFGGCSPVEAGVCQAKARPTSASAQGTSSPPPAAASRAAPA